MDDVKYAASGGIAVEDHASGKRPETRDRRADSATEFPRVKKSAVERAFDFLFFFSIGTVFSYALTSSVIAATILELPKVTLFWMNMGFTFAFFILLYNKRSFFVFMVALAVTLLAVYLYLRWHNFKVDWYIWLYREVNKLILFFERKISYNEKYSLYAGIGVSFLMSFLSAFNTRIYFSFFIPAVLSFCVVGIPAYMGWGYDEQAVNIIMLCLLILLVKRLNLFTLTDEKGRTGQNSVFAFVLIPVCLLFFTVSLHLPKPDVTSALDSIQYNLFNFGGNGRGRGINVGAQQTASFSGDGARLGGPMSMGDEYVMDVEAEEPVYLTGSVSDTYTGASWMLTSDGREAITRDENNLYDISRYPEEIRRTQRYFMRYYDRNIKSITIHVGDTRTNNIFTPPFPSTLWMSDSLRLTQDEEGAVASSNALPRNTYYTQEYISWDYSSVYMPWILDGSAQAMETDGEAMSRYLALPQSLPQRVRGLAASITQGIESDYEKIKALEAYLTRYTYTLTPEYVPFGADFVDYFLFEGKEGYCVYYASALAVMARCEGIPTRYVEGFAMPRERNENGTFTVTNAQAHAWTQAYFPGFGWVNFEPTKPFYSEMYNIPAADSGLPYWENTYEDYLNEEYMNQDDYNAAQAMDTSLNEEYPAADYPDIDMKRIVSAMLTVVAAIIMIFFAAAAVIFWRYKVRLRKMDKLPNSVAVVSYYTRILGAAREFGCPMQDDETAIAYAGRTGGRGLFSETGLPAMELADIFSRACYSRQEISDREKNAVRDCYASMMYKLRGSKRNIPSYAFKRYILARY